MALGQWFLRCLPGLSTVLLFVLLESSLGVARSAYSYLHSKHPEPVLTSVALQLVFSIYTLFLHFLAFTFPLRLSYAARTATKAIWSYHTQDEPPVKVAEQRVTMVIVIPCYKETLETMRETLDVLACHQAALQSYDVYLAMEERDPDALSVSKQLTTEYAHRFFDFQSTFHPPGIPGESAGKSSNVSWAAKEVMVKYSGAKDVVVTVMDSDSHLMPQYFQSVREHHNNARRQDNFSDFVLYVPPIVFDRNAHQVPLLVRVADLMWSGAGLSCYGKASAKSHLAIPTSVYSVSLPLVQLSNGWDAGPDAIGEDMHMMLKCYFATKGQVRIISLPSPASSCNISVSSHGIRGWFEHLNARYKQALRHMWGCLDSGYALGQWITMDCKPQAAGPHESSPMVRPRLSPSRKPSNPPAPMLAEPRRFTFRTINLFTRLVEAHCLPTHLFIIVVASALFTALPRPSSQWLFLDKVLDLTGYLRAGGFFFMTMYFVLVYEEYHHVCVSAREREMKKAGLLDQVTFSRRKRWSLRSLVDYVIFPIAGTLYGGFPLLQASLTHFWTMNLVYLVSAKPVRAVSSLAGANGGANTGVNFGQDGMRAEQV